MRISNTNEKQVEALANKHGLETRWLTSGENGYPRHLRLCITGFDTFKQAEALAEETGGEVISIRRRDGWRFAESRGSEYEGFDIEAFMLEDYEHLGIHTCHTLKEYLEIEKESLKQRIDDVNNFDDFNYIVDQINEAQKVANEARDMSEDEFLAVYEDCEEVVYPKSGTYYNHDVWTHEIAVEWADFRYLDDLAEYINGCDEYIEDIDLICEINNWELGEGDVVAIDKGCMEQLVRQDGELKVIELPEDYDD